MPKIEILKPVDAAIGKRRLLDELKGNLDSEEFSDFRWLVAYAKVGPLQRLKSRLEAWRKNGRTVRAIFGIDQQGTSREALELALALCDEVYVTQERGITFHPKAYVFTGITRAKLYLGSNNLTVGGTETNFEAAVVVDATLPVDNAVLAEMNELWNQLLPAQCVATRVLNQTLLDKLVADGDVVDEITLRKTQKAATKAKKSSTSKTGLKLKPPSPLPAGAKATKAAQQAAPTTASPQAVAISIAPPAAQAIGLAIQIKPHGNGEIHLSKLAVNQNPAFFEFPFNAIATPKNAGGTPYPQRLPDPVVNIQVYGAGGALLLKDDAYSLNTVFYEPKKEIRITASKLVSVVPEYSVMVMTPGEAAGIDYELAIYTPDSPDYVLWVATCNQQMPGGGKIPRKFGWF
jgi:HKD family nuclease